TVLPAAAYSRSDFVSLALSKTNPGDHRILPGHGADIVVPCLRLDAWLSAFTIDVAKIDTQGADHDVIAGMEGLLRRHPSMLLLAEFWLEGMEATAVDPELVLSDYRKLGFRLSLLAS